MRLMGNTTSKLKLAGEDSKPIKLKGCMLSVRMATKKYF